MGQTHFYSNIIVFLAVCMAWNSMRKCKKKLFVLYGKIWVVFILLHIHEIFLRSAEFLTHVPYIKRNTDLKQGNRKGHF